MWLHILIQVKTKSIPSFLVWLITDPRLYYPLHQEKDTKKWNQRQRKGASVDVYLWKAVIDPSKLQVEDHPQFKGVCLVKTEGKITSPRCPGVMLHSFYFIIFTFRFRLPDHRSILSRCYQYHGCFEIFLQILFSLFFDFVVSWKISWLLTIFSTHRKRIIPCNYKRISI